MVRGVNKSEGIVEVCPKSWIDVLWFPDIAQSVSVPTLVEPIGLFELEAPRDELADIREGGMNASY